MSDVINEIKPGVPMTDEQRKALAEENAKQTSEAQDLAAKHRARDIEEGRGEPPVNSIASLIKSKLEKEEFEPNLRATKASE
jgi:hypothetical protein